MKIEEILAKALERRAQIPVTVSRLLAGRISDSHVVRPICEDPEGSDDAHACQENGQRK
jgi:hypothetical protein